MSRNRCFVELKDGKCVRIFRNPADARLSGVEVFEWARKDATGSIRQQVYDRAQGECERCGKRLSWKQMHMDEKVSRGEGGEISLDNSWVLCYDCHLGENEYSEHGNRRWNGRRK